MLRHTTFPLMLIVFGAAWLAHELGWVSSWESVIAAGLIVIGVAILLTEGINRQSVVSGPILVYCGAAWLAFLHDAISERVVWPLGVVVLGVLLFISRTPLVAQTGRRASRRDSQLPPGAP